MVIKKRNLFRINLAFAILALLLFSWLSSGSLAPYANTSHEAKIIDSCGYLGSIDHDHFHKTFLFLKSSNQPELWQGSFVLRRILYPLISYPFMSLFGFLLGGFVTNILLMVLSILLLFRYFKKLIPQEGMGILIWLFVTYPGIYYYVGLPYSYNMIVPVCAMSAILLRKTFKSTKLKEIHIYSFLIGILFTGYELLPFFGVAQLFLILRKKYYSAIISNFALLVAPSMTVLMVLKYGFNEQTVNENSSVLGNVLSAWFGIFSMDAQAFQVWIKFLKRLPWVITDNYFTSTFVYLSFGYALIFLFNKKFSFLKGYFTDVQKGVFAGAIILFLFNNLAPPYSGWQMREDWIGRLYQPIFLEMIFFLALVYATVQEKGGFLSRSFVKCVVLMILVGNLLTVFSPSMRNELFGFPYWAFYKHSPSSYIHEHTGIVGVTPLGICREL